MPRKEENPKDQKPDLRKIVEDLKKMDPRIKSIKTTGDAKSQTFQLEFEANKERYTLSLSQQTLSSKYDIELTETTYQLEMSGDEVKGKIKIGEEKSRISLDTPEIYLELTITTSRPMTDNQVNALDDWFTPWQEKRYEESEPFWLDTENKKLSIMADSVTPNPKDITDYLKELIEIAPIVKTEAEKILRENK